MSRSTQLNHQQQSWGKLELVVTVSEALAHARSSLQSEERNVSHYGGERVVPDVDFSLHSAVVGRWALRLIV